MGTTLTLRLVQRLLQAQEDLDQRRLGSMIVSIWSHCFWTISCEPKTLLKVHFTVDHIPFLESLTSRYHLELIQSGPEETVWIVTVLLMLRN